MDIIAQTTRDAFLQAFEDTFEGIAFSQVLSRDLQDQPVVANGDEFCAYIDLTSPMNARFFVMMSRDHALECFSSVYTGIDQGEVDDAVLLDFVSELTNTAAGHFSTTVAPEKDDMVIGLPIRPDESQRDACLAPCPDGAVYILQIEEYPLTVSLMPLRG